MEQGRLTPHFPGMEAAAAGLRPVTLPAACLRQLQTACRSAVVLARALRFFTPLQQLAGGAPLPDFANPKHGAMDVAACPQVMAPSDCGAISSTSSAATAATTRMSKRIAIATACMYMYICIYDICMQVMEGARDTVC